MHFPDDTMLARGANRVCVRDPSSDAHCLKYELPPEERTPVGVRQQFRRWLARRIPALGENRTELRAWRSLHARLGNDLDRFVAPCEAIVDTPHGPALRCALVREDSGAPAASLYRHLFELRIHDAGALCAAVDAIEAWLLRHGIPLFDLNSGNFVVVTDPDAPAGLRLVCIDVKSILDGREIVPLSKWIPALGARKIRRRTERLRQRIRDHAPGTPPAE